MQLSSLQLQNFRNYRKKAFSFSANTTLFVGDNAIGKTNILEAIYLLAIGRSFRATREQQMILYGQELARVVGEVNGSRLELVLTTGKIQGEKTPRKRYLVNGVAKRKMDFVGNLRAVSFRPEDIELVLGSPATRRDYLDSVLEQSNREYRRSHLAYQKGLRRRNKLLEKIREGEAERKQLLFWNQLLIKNGELVSRGREEMIEFVNSQLIERDLDLKLKYDHSNISQTRLDKYANEEVAAATTLVGPHRDDFNFISQRQGKAEKDLSIYGSRGEQRMAVLMTKLAELEFIHHQVEEKPILLLDDIFSELDDQHCHEVLSLLPHQQTIMTITDVRSIPEKHKKEIEIINLG